MNSFVGPIPDLDDPGLSQLPGYCWVLFVNVTTQRLHLFPFCLWLWFALPEIKPVYCWALFCCGVWVLNSGPLPHPLLNTIVDGFDCGCSLAIGAPALLFKTSACICYRN